MLGDYKSNLAIEQLLTVALSSRNHYPTRSPIVRILSLIVMCILAGRLSIEVGAAEPEKFDVVVYGGNKRRDYRSGRSQRLGKSVS